MKKRILMFAVIAGLVLSLNASAWAASYAINEIITEYTALYNAESREGEPLNIRIRTIVNTGDESHPL